MPLRPGFEVLRDIVIAATGWTPSFLLRYTISLYISKDMPTLIYLAKFCLDARRHR